MKVKIKALLNLLILTVFLAKAYTQDVPEQDTTIYDTLEIKAIAQPFVDSITVRWAPTNQNLWKLANQSGYNLNRLTFYRNGKYLTKEERKASAIQLATGLKPLPKEAWRPIVEGDDMAFLAAGMLYGEDFDVPEPSSRYDLEAMQQQNQLEHSRYGYALFAADQSLPTAIALGLGYVDKQVKPLEGYIYYVTLVKPIQGSKIIPGMAMVSTNRKLILPKPPELNVWFGDQVAHLSWNNEPVAEHFTSYYVERSDDLGRTFTQINPIPIVHLATEENKKYAAFTDSLHTNNKRYVYRVRGKTPFGEYSPPSDTVSGMGRPTPIDALPQISDVVEFPKGKMQIRWHFHEDYNNRISGFNVYRGERSTDQLVQINAEPLPPDQRVYTDQFPMITAYYQIKVIDENGYELGGFPVLAQLADNTPPAAPQNLTGRLDTATGYVHLSWSPNQEEDLRGYRVYMSNLPEGHYTQISKTWTEDTTFVYQPNQNAPNERWYFRVLAMDYRDNFSFHSAVCPIKMPDQHPPAPPVFKAVKATENGVLLEMAGSSSKDVTGHQLQRKSGEGTDWVIIQEIDQVPSPWYFRDTLTTVGSAYQYRIVAEDDDKLKTPSKTIDAAPIDLGIRDSIQRLQGRLAIAQNAIQLQWEYPESDAVQKFIIYRSKGNRPMTTYKIVSPEDLLALQLNQTTESKAFSFIDRNVQKNKEYHYQVMARYRKGKTSPLSPIVTVSN